jgi:hypothetical protein
MKELSGKLTALQLEFNLTGPGWASTISIDFESRRVPVFARRSSETTIRDPNPMKTSALVIALVFTSHFANAAFVYHDSASTTAGTFVAGTVVFGIGNLKNSGHDSHLDTENAALNGESYATSQPPAGGFPVTITLEFNDPLDLTKFYLWNHTNNSASGALNSGMEEFTLTFYTAANGGGSQIGTVYSNTALPAPTFNGTYAAQVFDFGSTYQDVRSARLAIASRIDDTNSFVAIRELGFEAIPEPSSALLGGLGLLALLRRRR